MFLALVDIENISKLTFMPREISDQPEHLSSLIKLLCPHKEYFGPKLPNDHIRIEV